jgi:multiple sugar transport system substrate-binding protein
MKSMQSMSHMAGGTRNVRGGTRRTIMLGTALGGAALVAACGPLGGNQGREQAGAKTLRSDVTVSFLQTTGQVEQELVNQVVDRWRQAHPNGPKAEFSIVTGNVGVTFTTLLAGGTPPALVSMDAGQGVVFAERGDFAPLDEFIKRDRYDLADYIPVSLEQYRWKSKLYALLRDFSHQSMWINLDLFAKDGIQPPSGDYKGTVRGWDFGAFVEAARRMTKWDGSSTARAAQYGFPMNTGLRGGYGQFVAANGGELFDKEFRRCTVDSEPVVEALQLMQDLRYRHRIAPDGAALREWQTAGQTTSAQNLFFDGLVGMAIFPVARIGEARRLAKGQWDLAVAPVGKGKRVTTGGGVGWYQVKSVPHQEEAWAVLKHLTSPETHRFLADVRIPGRKSALDAWLAEAPGEAPKSRSVARTGQDVVSLDPIFPQWVRIESEVFTPQLTRLWNNEATAREVGREIATQANRILAEQSPSR